MKKIKHILVNNAKAYRYIWTSVPDLFLYGIIQAALAGIQPVFTIWYFRYLIDAVMEGVLISNIFEVTVIMCLLIVGKQIYDSFYNKILYPKKEIILKESLRELLYKKISNLDIAYYDDSETYEEINKAMKEIDTRFLEVFKTSMNILRSSIVLLVSLSIVLSLDLYILLFSISSLVISILYNVKYNKAAYEYEMEQINEIRKCDYVHRIFYLKDYAQDVRTTNLSELLFSLHGKAFSNIRLIFEQSNPILMKYDVLPQVISLVLKVCSIFYIIYGISTGRFSVGSFAALLNGTGEVTATISGLFVFLPKFQQNSMYLDNLFGILDKKNYVCSGTVPFTGKFTELEFRRVSFKYPGSDNYALQDISFHINKGEMLGIVGHNGAGKSTLIKLLLRLYDPTEGEILLDGINYKEYKLEDLRSAMGAVFQNYMVYPFSTYENIAMSNVPKVAFPIIDNVLYDVGLHDKLCSEVIKQKPLSNEFDDGVILSGGEQQKVSIARLLYGQQAIVMLDEPSSALDPIAEVEIINCLYKGFGDKTVFMISHRLSATKHCNALIHLENGRIIEYGSHEELMNKGGRYCEMYNLQAKNYMSNTLENSNWQWKRG